MTKCKLLIPHQDIACWETTESDNEMTGTTETGMEGAVTETAILRVVDSILGMEISQTMETIRSRALGALTMNGIDICPSITQIISRIKIQRPSIQRPSIQRLSIKQLSSQWHIIQWLSSNLRVTER